MEAIRYQIEPALPVGDFIDVLNRSTLGERRPVGDRPRMEAMLRGAGVVATARDGDRVVGVARALTDFAFCTYLSDLAVDREYQRRGIGRRLLRLTHETAGLQTTLILVAAPQAVEYYPHIGLDRHDSCWVIPGSPPGGGGPSGRR